MTGPDEGSPGLVPADGPSATRVRAPQGLDEDPDRDRREDGDAAHEPLHPPPPAVFSLEGRAVPALYLVGWVGTVMGLAILVVSLLSSGAGAARWLFLAGLLVLGVGVVAAAGSQAIERSRRPWLTYRGPSPVLAFVAAIAVTLVAVAVVIAPLAAAGLDPTSPLATTLSLALTAAAYVLVVRVLVVGPGALSWAEMGVRRPDGAAVRELLVGAVAAVPVIGVTLVLSGVLGSFLERTPSPLPAPTDALGLALNLLSAAVLAPVGEELFFRGFATTAWARALGSAWPAIVRGAVFFAIAHVLTLFDASFATGAQRAVFSFLGLLPVAIALGWLFLARRSLYAAIGLHGAFNGIQVLLAFLVAGSLAQ